MIQEYLFELDSKTAAQVITVIGGQAALITSYQEYQQTNGACNAEKVRNVMNLVFVAWALD